MSYKPIKGALQELKKASPETAITEFLIRQLCKNGKVKTIIAGKSKVLVNMESLNEYLDSGDKPIMSN